MAPWAYTLCLCVIVGLAGYGLASAATSTELTLRVTRTSARMWVFPLDTTIRDSASVQRLYDASLALPGVPNGIYNCPADFGTSYRLGFLRGTSQVQQMGLDPDGCRILTIGSERSEHSARHMNGSFLALFMQTVSIQSL
jgi:hypothetical protein